LEAPGSTCRRWPAEAEPLPVDALDDLGLRRGELADVRIEPDPALGETQRALGVGRGGDLLGDLDAIRRSRCGACPNPRAVSPDRWGVPPALVAGRRDLVGVSTYRRAVGPDRRVVCPDLVAISTCRGAVCPDRRVVCPDLVAISTSRRAGWADLVELSPSCLALPRPSSAASCSRHRYLTNLERSRMYLAW
jgi:hypothetical protein